ncbi:PspC domain-containing protein [Sphaerisporangium sp. NPDC051017]|uniref:PspC domain-containing protein n=1 Tax=unclassified Sphaerisporangium TaxID=2630420 RepID=UPI0033C64C10
MNEMNLHGHSTVKELRRTRQGRIVAGVCSGAAEFIGIDANILRIGLAIATFFGGLGVGIYAVAWLLIPEESKQTSIVQDLIGKQKSDPGSTWHQAASYWEQGVNKARKEWGPRDQAPSYPAPAPAPQQPAARPASPVDEPPTTV